MPQTEIKPHQITTPIQLLAVWFAALVIVVSAFLGTASIIDSPSWVCPMLAIAAVLFVPLFLVAAFIMQTRFRTHLQEDPYYSDWLKTKEQSFSDFKPESISARSISEHETTSPTLESVDNLESHRIETYTSNQGLFLVHDWRPSLIKGQVADIIIWLHQHGEGPLSLDSIEKVQYQLGPQFFDDPVDKYNANEKFKLEVSAYSPMLCVASIFLRGQSTPLILQRYINFEDTTEINTIEPLRKLRIWCQDQDCGQPGTIIPDYIFASSTHGAVAVSPVEENIMLQKGWIELVEGKGVRITDKGRKAVFG